MAAESRLDDETIVARQTERIVALSEHVRAMRSRFADRENLPGVNALLDALERATDDAARRRRIEAGDLKPGRGVDVGQAIKNVNHLQTVVGLYLSSIAVTHGDDFDTLIRPFRRLAQSLAANTEIVFQPSEIEMYRISEELIQYLERSELADVDLAKALGDLPRVVVVEYPAAGEGEVFAHSQIAHELGHLVLRQPDPAESRRVRQDVLFDRFFDPHANRVRAQTRYDPELSRPSEKKLQEMPTRQRSRLLRRLEKNQQAEGDFQNERLRLSKWALEFFCDALAVRMLGPAFFFALYELASRGDRWYTERNFSQYKTHPHLAWRLAELSRATNDFFDPKAAEAFLTATGLADDAEHKHLLRLLSKGRQLVERLVAKAPPEYHEPIEHDVITPAVAEIHEHAPGVLNGAEFERELLWRELCPIFQKLKAGIPPAERLEHRRRLEGSDHIGWKLRRAGESRRNEHRWSTPFDWRSILNGAYLHALLDPQPGPASTLVDATRISRRRHQILNAVRGSVELSELLRQARALQDDAAMLDPAPHALA